MAFFLPGSPSGMARGRGALFRLFFFLVLKSLLRTVRADVDITGLTLGNTEHKLSAYADNVFFHLKKFPCLIA